MGLIKKIALALALMGSSVMAEEPKQIISYNNDYMNNKIEQYFEQYSNRRAYQDSEDKNFVFLSKSGRTVEQFKELEKQDWTPETLNEFMQDNMQYVSDVFDGHQGTDYMKSPLEFYLTGKGDCEDFANFAHYFLSKSGYEVSIINFQPERFEFGTHVVCLIQKEGNFAYISNIGDKCRYNGNFKEMFNVFDAIIKEAGYSDWLSVSEIVANYSLKKGYELGWVIPNPYFMEVLVETYGEFSEKK